MFVTVVPATALELTGLLMILVGGLRNYPHLEAGRATLTITPSAREADVGGTLSITF